MKIKQIAAVFLIVCVCLASVGCKSDSSSTGRLMSYSLSADPQNIDPQMASDNNSLLIVNNIFEGLLSKTVEGKITEGVAESYSISSDGLTYTFTLRNDARWMHRSQEKNEYHNTPVIADDFVFAFQRLLSPNINSPYAKDFYCIQNAQSVHNGSLSVDQLGVRADTDTQLTITLEYANPLFLDLLTTAPAMPCNRAFFESTNGQYGLDIDSILSNGPFYIREWSLEHYVRIRQNPVYSSWSPVVASGANLTIRNEEETYQRLDAGDIDNGVLPLEWYQKLKQSDFNVTEFENSVWGIGFNNASVENSELMSNAEIRNALAMSLDRTSYQTYLNENAVIANSIVPSSVTLLEDSYRTLAGEELAPAYSPEEAKIHLQTGLSQVGEGSINSISILVPEGSSEIMDMISQVWQQNLQVFFKIEVLPQEEYQERLEDGDFDCALMKFTSDANTPSSILSKFSSGSSQNSLSYRSETVDGLIQQATVSSTVDDMVQQYRQAEQAILDDGAFLPLYFEKEYFVSRKDISDIRFEPSSKLLFFKDAKKG